jgi:hypothetical protein
VRYPRAEMPMTEIPVMATQSVSTIISVVREKTISWTESSMQEDCSSSVCPESDCDAMVVAVEFEKGAVLRKRQSRRVLGCRVDKVIRQAAKTKLWCKEK